MKVLPWAQQHFGDEKWTFRQDSAPAHRAKDWCRNHFPLFIPSQEWTPYSPDPNPLDYSAILQKVGPLLRLEHESLKQVLSQEWKKITPEELRPIALNFVKRLKLCIRARGGYFETAWTYHSWDYLLSVNLWICTYLRN